MKRFIAPVLITVGAVSAVAAPAVLSAAASAPAVVASAPAHAHPDTFFQG